MQTHRRQRFIRAQLGWMLGVALVLSLLNSLSLEVFFILSLTGLLIIYELTAPNYVTPGWRARVRWLVVLGLVAFTVLVVRRVLAILPAGVI